MEINLILGPGLITIIGLQESPPDSNRISIITPGRASLSLEIQEIIQVGMVGMVWVK